MIIKHWTEIPGWFTPADATTLRKLLRRVPHGGLVANVGCFCGRNLAACAEEIQTRQITVLAVDTWQGTPGVQMESSDWPGVENLFRAVVHEFGLDLLVQMVKRESLLAAEAQQLRSLDLVFLDADHSKPALRADIAAWRPLLKYTGILCGHDYGDPAWPAVRELVNVFSPNVQIGHDSSVWWVDLA